ncbi:hypothetical protein FM106_27755 [Brachybacterium faecium]|nr:hypothetical protein FM106_27755 [Brachybacterium faecium]
MGRGCGGAGRVRAAGRVRPGPGERSDTMGPRHGATGRGRTLARAHGAAYADLHSPVRRERPR